ncbi:MAG: hypothetical protein WC956_03100 [bacterium]
MASMPPKELLRIKRDVEKALGPSFQFPAGARVCLAKDEGGNEVIEARTPDDKNGGFTLVDVKSDGRMFLQKVCGKDAPRGDLGCHPINPAQPAGTWSRDLSVSKARFEAARQVLLNAAKGKK